MGLVDGRRPLKVDCLNLLISMRASPIMKHWIQNHSPLARLIADFSPIELPYQVRCIYPIQRVKSDANRSSPQFQDSLLVDIGS